MAQFRFVHIGVAMALVAGTLTAMAMVRDASAAGNGTSSVFVPIVPCRLADTRAGSDNVGARSTPVGPAETVQFAVWGSNGNCAIPNTATAIASNVTAVGPTASSFLTVFPADANPRPTASNLNVTSTSPPTPNQVTVALSAAGAIGVFNHSGAVNVIVDIVGYYIPASGGGTQGPPGIQGPPGPSGVTPQDVIWVAKSGGQFTSVSAAMNSITGGGPHLINVAPGTYVETAPIVMKNNVDLAGSGQDRTTIICACDKANASGQRSTVYVTGNTSTEIRDITITNSGAFSGGTQSAVAVELFQATAETSIVDTTMTATAGPAVLAIALMILASTQPHIDNINTYTTGAGNNIGVEIVSGSTAVIRNSWIYVSGPGNSVFGNAQSRLETSTVGGPTSGMAGRCDAVLDLASNPYLCA
jgi:hypothetical protein